MKVAIVHDYIKEYGGAERVLEALHEIWPKASIYTTVFLPRFLGPHEKRFEKYNIISSWFQNLPFVEKLISPLRIFSPNIFKSWDFSAYDLVIVSATGAYFPNLINKGKRAKHICYCHTPPRYLYGYPTARNWKKNIFGKILGEFFNHHLRMVDFASAQNSDFFIANSQEIKARIRKFYRRDAVVINPPVGMVDKTRSWKLEAGSWKDRNYYITGGRLARAKHIDLVIEACNRMKLPLKIFGRGFAGYEKELKEIAGDTIEFVGEVTDDELINLYKNAKALIYPSEYEDFGIIPVEAQSCGTPVIGLNQAGVKETVIDGETGVLFEELSVEGVVKAITRFENLGNSVNWQKNCRENAKKYSKERFKREISNFINSKLKT